MQAVFARLGQLDPDIAILLIFIGLVYGLFGWRIVRYLAFADACFIALILTLGLLEMEGRSTYYLPTFPLATVLLIGLPWLAWRFSRWAVGIMSGAVGFLIIQMLLTDSQTPLFARLAIGVVGASLAMALKVTLTRETAIVVTGLHGGWLCVAALSILAVSPDSFAGQFFNTLYHTNAMLIPLLAISLSAILIAVQWADMERDLNPFYVA